jgi:hypothetical protein
MQCDRQRNGPLRDAVSADSTTYNDYKLKLVIDFQNRNMNRGTETLPTDWRHYRNLQ